MDPAHQRGLSCAVACAAVWLVAAPPAKAQDASPPPAEAAPEQVKPAVLLVVGEGQGEEGERTTQALESLFIDAGLRLEVRFVTDLASGFLVQMAQVAGIAAEVDPILSVWCAFGDDGEIVVHMAEPGSDEVLVRRVTPEDTGMDGRFDAAALIVLSTAEALITTEPPPEPAPEPPPPAPDGPPETPITILPDEPPEMVEVRNVRRPHFVIFGRYAPKFFAPQKLIAHEGTVAVGLSFLDSWTFLVGYGITPLKVSESGLEMRSVGNTLRLFAQYQKLWKILTIGAEAGASLTATRWSVYTFGSGDHEQFDSEGGPEFSMSLDFFFRLGWRIRPWFFIHAGAGVAVRVINHEHVTTADGEQVIFLSPWWLQPIVALDVTLQF